MRNLNAEKAIQIIEKAIMNAAWDNQEAIIVDVPVTGKKTCRAIREHFEKEGWIVTKQGIRGEVGSGDRWDPIHEETIASRYTLKWW